jgi:dipeptidyl aminopeptidase/acylaminoacyl peptidase
MDPDGEHLWVIDTKSVNRLRRYRLADGAMDEPIAAKVDDIFAGFSLIFSRRTRAIAGMIKDRLSPSEWWAPEYHRAQRAVDTANPEGFNRLVSVDDADERFLFESGNPRDPGKHVLYEAKTGKIHVLTVAAPWLEKAPLANGEYFLFSARDAMALDARITLPLGPRPARGWPMMVLIRDELWDGVSWEFRPEVQFLVNRGFAVLEPNQRSSSRAEPQLSTDDLFNLNRMHEDITDATRATMAKWKIDPARIAIMASQFGATLAVSGAALEPTLYRCVVGIGGVYDWETFLRDRKFGFRSDTYAYLSDALGKPGTDKAQLAAMSPLSRADRIKVPVLLAHGKDDGSIYYNQSKSLASALKANGVPYETFFRANESNGFEQYRNRVDLYKTVEKFLSRHLAGEAAAK